MKTIDANFKMKQKDKGIENDPPLGDGWAHWVANAPFKAYVKKYGHVIEVRWTFSPNMIPVNEIIISRTSATPTYVLPTTRTAPAKD